MPSCHKSGANVRCVCAGAQHGCGARPSRRPAGRCGSRRRVRRRRAWRGGSARPRRGVLGRRADSGRRSWRAPRARSRGAESRPRAIFWHSPISSACAPPQGAQPGPRPVRTISPIPIYRYRTYTVPERGEPHSYTSGCRGYVLGPLIPLATICPGAPISRWRTITKTQMKYHTPHTVARSRASSDHSGAPAPETHDERHRSRSVSADNTPAEWVPRATPRPKMPMPMPLPQSVRSIHTQPALPRALGVPMVHAACVRRRAAQTAVCRRLYADGCMQTAVCRRLSMPATSVGRSAG